MRFEQLDSPIQRLIKRLLLALDDLLDVVLLGADFGEDIAHRVGQDGDQLVEERLVEAERAAVADGAAQDAAQDVVAVVVAGLDAVGNREAQRADVVGDDAEGDVDLLLLGRRRQCRPPAGWSRISCRSASPACRRCGRKMSVS